MDEALLLRDLAIMQKCMGLYSEHTQDKLFDILNTEDLTKREKQITLLEEILKKDPTEEEFLQEIKKLKNTP